MQYPQPIENRKDARCTGFEPETIGEVGPMPSKLLKMLRIDGAGRGNRTPMELLPTDFEFPKNTVGL